MLQKIYIQRKLLKKIRLKIYKIVMNLRIDEVIDKGLYYKKISNDKVINITGEGGSGKSTLANGYRNDENYLVVDYDMILLNPDVGTIEYELKEMLIKK